VKLLKITMMLNSASCIIFGVLFVLGGGAVNTFIGNSFAWLTPLVGAVLIFNGCHLLFASKRESPICLEVLYFILGDFVWVVASVILIVLGIVVTTSHGTVAALLIAAMVGLFGILQLIGYKKVCTKR